MEWEGLCERKKLYSWADILTLPFRLDYLCLAALLGGSRLLDILEILTIW